MAKKQIDPEQFWRNWFTADAFTVEMGMIQAFKLLPRDPRCKICNSPFEGAGGFVMSTLFGRKRSTMNHYFCNACEGFARLHPGGAEVEMSMLFVDVRGSTALSEQMSAMEFQKLINRFFVVTTKIISDEFGLVEKLAGDAVAAFWGAGFAGPDYVVRTVRAAQKIIKSMDAQEIPVGIGVHTGVAYFGAMGEENGLINISAIGDEVNTAARLASKAAAGEIIVSERALKQAAIHADEFESRSLELKGISEPVSVRVLRA